ncbi:PepSY-associated TM helix domain-containing protein [Leucothrix arctica]|uniref:PepSY domain-containing protein n=1 Tax=Leucothrix arctica TaxID=1481894 RepID=A0A317CLZ9_9GAMM|nr:PepSY domain-containing protein [Leucothrix arctica]PWQ99237.1 hypothetical protein DKT75_01440 [Leucothrix arctica]
MADTTSSPLYRSVWKWHFLAALYVLPFMLILSVTGGIYLFKPQIEEFIYSDLLNVEIQAQKTTLETQQAAVLAAAPGSRIRSITTEETEGRSTVFEIQDSNRTRSYAWVDPYSAEVIRVQDRESTLMYQLKKIHSELLLGETGAKFVEIAAHWAIVMFITGFFLWWPRGKGGIMKAFRLPKGTGRPWWKQTHLLTGIFASLLIIPMLISGLPWTDVWGSGYSYVQSQTGQKSPSLRFSGGSIKSTATEGETIAYETVLIAASEQGLVTPYELRPPKNAQGAYWIRSASKNRWDQTELIIDQYSGKVLTSVNFEDYPVMAKASSLGVSFHQGELYGWLNLAQNSLAACLGVILAVSGFAAWWTRRPVGSLGVPAAPQRNIKLGTGITALIVFLAIFLPLMGVSLVVAMLLDWLIFKRLNWFRSKADVIA